MKWQRAFWVLIHANKTILTVIGMDCQANRDGSSNDSTYSILGKFVCAFPGFHFHCQSNTNYILSYPFLGCNVAWGICGHSFHTHCISRWLKTRNSCPVGSFLLISSKLSCRGPNPHLPFPITPLWIIHSWSHLLTLYYRSLTFPYCVLFVLLRFVSWVLF